MTKKSFTSATIGKVLVIPMLALVALTFNSCTKKECASPTQPASTATTDNSLRLRNVVGKALRDFATAQAGGSSQQAGSGSGSNSFSNPATNYTTYSTPSGTVYSWSDPTTGTSFKLTESSGSGLGQLSYNGKSFDYNYVLSIKASSTDQTWSGFLSGRDLRGAVAIDGELTDATFSLKNLAIFLVGTNGGTGSYKFIKFNSSSVSGENAVGELLDFSAAATPTLAAMNSAKFYITSDGHINVSETSFEMASDAKVKEVTTNTEYSIAGTISTE
jgi:hypothetical protein